MNRVLIACFALVCLIGCGSVAAQETPFAALQKWAGKLPFDTIDGKTLWEQPIFQAASKKAMGDDYYEMVFNELSKGVTSTIRQKNDVMLVSVCKEHACPDNYANIFINIKKSVVNVCWHLASEGGDKWFSSTQKATDIPKNACGAVDEFTIYNTFAKE